MKTQKDIIIRRAFEIMWKDGDPKNGELLTADKFEELAYKDKRLDKWLERATYEYTEIVTNNLHREL